MAATVTEWTAIEHTPGGARGWRLRGAEVVEMIADASDEAGGARLVAGATDAPVEKVPAPARPEAPDAASGPWLLPALAQDSPPGRLEATRLRVIGFLSLNPGWDGVLCLPEADATHWVQVSADEIVSFQSFLTGRLLSALGGAAPADAQALADSLARPERLAAHLRSAEVTGTPGAAAGHLVGAELAAARAFWLGQQVALIGEGALSESYRAALEGQAVPLVRASAEAVTRKGLAALAPQAPGGA